MIQLRDAGILSAIVVFAGLSAGLPVFAVSKSAPAVDFLILLALAALSSLVPLGGIGKAVRPLGGAIAIAVAVVVIGPGAGSWIGVIASLCGWFHLRYRRQWLWAELMACAWVPLAVGEVFYASVGKLGVERSSYLYLLAIAVGMTLGFAFYLLVVAAYERAAEGAPLLRLFRELVRWNGVLFVVACTLTVVVSYVALHEGSLGLFASCAVVIFGQWACTTIDRLARQAQGLRLRSNQLTAMQFVLLRALIESLNLRDTHAADHAAHTAAYARDLAARFGMSERWQNLVHAAGVLHDIGKYSFPDELFDLPSDLLDRTARELIRRHPTEGAAIVAQLSGYAEVARIIANHHERSDGSGYPEGLSGNDVPLSAQIVGISEAYDMMVRGTPYSPPIPWQQALKLLADMGFPASLYRCFREMILAASERYRNARFTDFNRELAKAERFMRTL